MENFLSGEWLTIITLAVQAGILKFAYRLYKNFTQKETNRDSAIRGLLTCGDYKYLPPCRKRMAFFQYGHWKI